MNPLDCLWRRASSDGERSGGCAAPGANQEVGTSPGLDGRRLEPNDPRGGPASPEERRHHFDHADEGANQDRDARGYEDLHQETRRHATVRKGEADVEVPFGQLEQQEARHLKEGEPQRRPSHGPAGFAFERACAEQDQGDPGRGDRRDAQ